MDNFYFLYITSSDEYKYTSAHSSQRQYVNTSNKDQINEEIKWIVGEDDITFLFKLCKETRASIKNWCNENLSNSVVVTNHLLIHTKDVYKIYFSNEEDAVGFKLVWSHILYEEQKTDYTTISDMIIMTPKF